MGGSAWCWPKRGGRATTDDGEWEGELTVAPSVLAALPLGGRGVTGDALSGPTALCRQIRRQGGDYLVTIKANQPDPRWAVQTVFATPPHGERFATAVAWEQHGDRGETRRLWASTALRDYLTWPGAARVIMVERVCRRRDRRTREVRDCLTSLGPAVAPAALRDPIRGHWRLENRLH